MGRVSFTEVPFPSMEVGKGGEGRGEGRKGRGKGRGKGGKRGGKGGKKGRGKKGGKKEGGIAPAMGPPWEGEENDKRAKQAQSLSRLGNRASARSRAKLD